MTAKEGKKILSTQNLFLALDAAVDPAVKIESAEPREKLSWFEIPNLCKMGGIKSVFKLYVKVIAMMGKLVLRVTTGKRGRKY